MIKKSFCKINIGLNVIQRRDDGFSEIQTVMYPVRGICDLVELVCGREFQFSSSGIVVDCANDQNLCVRAFNLMKEEYDLPPVSLHLHKNIPFGAGLGAGSANAVAVIDLCDDLFTLNLSSEIKRRIATKLGSDTAFFVDQVPALASGRGEILEPLDLNLNGYYIYMVKPDLGVSTANAYKWVVPKEPLVGLKELIAQPISQWRDTILNDFEKPIFERLPCLMKIKEDMYDKGAIFASMSGSGSTVYGVFDRPVLLNYSHFSCVVKL